MAQISFMRWCVDPKGRTPVSVDPMRVDCTEFFSDAFNHPVNGDNFPAATKIIMKGKQEYVVQGSHKEVVTTLNHDSDHCPHCNAEWKEHTCP